MKKVINRIKKNIKRNFYRFKNRNAVEYSNPNNTELNDIESELVKLGEKIEDLYINQNKFNNFVSEYKFPSDYHGGVNSGVWFEKLLEHFIAFELLGIEKFRKKDIYVDIAGSNSPWVKILREKNDIEAFCIDLEVSPFFSIFPYYKVEDATKSSLLSGSVKGASLQCAFEMFQRDNDINLITELKRILAYNGKVIIVPLYLHTHYCSYSSPEYFGKCHSDSESIEYIRNGIWGIPSSRKYSAIKLKERILSRITDLGMNYTIYVLRNGKNVSPEIYCHFILEIYK